MKKIDIGQNAKVLVVWHTQQRITTDEEEKNIATAMSKKYGIPVKNIHVEKKFESNDAADGTLAGDVVQNINDPRFQQELMKQYLPLIKGIDPKDVDLEEIFKIDSAINAQIDYSLYNKGKKYSIKWVKWGNFLSYGPDNFFDFTKLHGLVLLQGVPGNKSGKSTFAYDLLHFLLFGKTNTNKAKTLGGLFNNYLPNERVLTTEGCINIDGDDYIIRRTLTRPAAGKKTKTVANKVEYFKLAPDGTEELLPETNEQGATTKATSKIIQDAIGNESDFDLIISANSKDLDSLITLTEAEKGRLLSRWIGLSVIEDKDAIARAKWNKEISIGRYCDMYNRAALQEDIENLTAENAETQKTIDENNKTIKSCEDKIVSENKVRDALLSSKQAIDPNLLKADAATITAAMETLVVNGKKRNAEAAQLEVTIKEFGNIEYSELEYKAKERESKTLVSQMSEMRAKINHLREENKNLASSEYCPVCHRKFENVDNTKLIQENDAQIKQLISTGVKMKEKNDALEKEIETMSNNRMRSQEKSKLELKLAAIKSELATQRAEYTEKRAILNEIKKNEDAIKKNNEIDTKLNVVDENIKVQERIKREKDNENVTLNRMIAKNNETIATKKSYIVKIDEEIKVEKNWKVYLQMIGKDGISKMVLKNTLPIINNEVNNLLSDAADFRVEIVMDDKNDIDFLLIRDGVTTRLSAASGLETTQAALALRVVLGKMSRLSRPPFILLDEVLGTVNKENYDAMKKLYDKIVSEYEFVLHICHIDLDWYDGNVITVVKKDNISYIQND